jgi:hypothetical protein
MLSIETDRIYLINNGMPYLNSTIEIHRKRFNKKKDNKKSL